MGYHIKRGSNGQCNCECNGKDCCAKGGGTSQNNLLCPEGEVPYGNLFVPDCDELCFQCQPCASVPPWPNAACSNGDFGTGGFVDTACADPDSCKPGCGWFPDGCVPVGEAGWCAPVPGCKPCAEGPGCQGDEVPAGECAQKGGYWTAAPVARPESGLGCCEKCECQLFQDPAKRLYLTLLSDEGREAELEMTLYSSGSQSWRGEVSDGDKIPIAFGNCAFKLAAGAALSVYDPRSTGCGGDCELSVDYWADFQDPGDGSAPLPPQPGTFYGKIPDPQIEDGTPVASYEDGIYPPDPGRPFASALRIGCAAPPDNDATPAEAWQSWIVLSAVVASL